MFDTKFPSQYPPPASHMDTLRKGRRGEKNREKKSFHTLAAAEGFPSLPTKSRLLDDSQSQPLFPLKRRAPPLFLARLSLGSDSTAHHLTTLSVLQPKASDPCEMRENFLPTVSCPPFICASSLIHSLISSSLPRGGSH